MVGWIRISVDETCHVVWSVRDSRTLRYFHAIGDGEVGNRVTSEMAEKRFEGGKCKTPWLPVLFAERAVTSGDLSHNCVTAAGRAMRRGWLYW